MKSSPPETRQARYDALMDEVRAAHRAQLKLEEPSEARWRALAASARAPKEALPRAWMRPVLAFCVLALAVGGVVVYDAGIERGAAPVAIATKETRAPGLWQAGDSPVSVDFAGGHTVKLAPHAILDVADASSARFDARVSAGSVTFSVAPRRAGDLFRVRLGGDYLEVRGTQFTVTVGDGPALVAVDHGVVEVFRGGASSFVRAGERWAAAPAKPEMPLENAQLAATKDRDDKAVPAAPQTNDADNVASNDERVAPPVTHATAADPKPAPRAARDASRSPPSKRVKTEVVDVAPQTSPIVGIEPLSPKVERALLASMRAGDCAAVERALATVVRAQGASAAGEAWWMRAWCARKRGDIPTSVRYFDKARGKSRWPIPDAATLPAVPGS